MNEMQSLAPPRLNVYPILAVRLFCPTCASLVLPSHSSAGATGSLLFGVVGVPGFEPGASCSQSRRSAKLSYTPMITGYKKPQRRICLS